MEPIISSICLVFHCFVYGFFYIILYVTIWCKDNKLIIYLSSLSLEIYLVASINKGLLLLRHWYYVDYWSTSSISMFEEIYSHRRHFCCANILQNLFWFIGHKNFQINHSVKNVKTNNTQVLGRNLHGNVGNLLQKFLLLLNDACWFFFFFFLTH